jgi:hypothetical protein
MTPSQVRRGALAHHLSASAAEFDYKYLITDMTIQAISASPSDKRRARRMRCYREARCVFNNGCSGLSVLVRNLSATGARLTGHELIHLPKTFELQISDGPESQRSRWVKRIWLRGESIGVTFIDAPAQATSSGTA